MKKLFAFILISVILFSAVCVPAFAEEAAASSYVTTNTFGDTSDSDALGYIPSDRALDELPLQTLPLTEAEKLQMAQAYAAQYNTSGDPASYAVQCFAKLTNGMSIVYVASDEWCYSDVLCREPIGDYIYVHGGDRSAKLYRDGGYTEFFDAYQNGTIGDDLLEEINDVMHFALPVSPTEPQSVSTTGTVKDLSASDETVNAENPTVEEPTSADCTDAPKEPVVIKATRDTAPHVKGSTPGAAKTATKTGDNGWLYIGIALAAIGALIVGITYLKKRIKKAE